MPQHSRGRKGQSTGTPQALGSGSDLQRQDAKTRVFLVDDEPIVRRGLRLLIGLQPNLVVCGEAAGENDGFEGVLSHRPDLAIVDLSLKEGAGLVLIRRLHQQFPELKILAFTIHSQAHFAAGAFAAGAHGYVTKDSCAEQILQAIEAIRKGRYYLCKTIAAQAPALLPRTGPHGEEWAPKPGGKTASGHSA